MSTKTISYFIRYRYLQNGKLPKLTFECSDIFEQDEKLTIKQAFDVCKKELSKLNPDGKLLILDFYKVV